MGKEGEPLSETIITLESRIYLLPTSGKLVLAFFRSKWL